MRSRRFAVAGCLGLAWALLFGPTARADLFDYVKKDDGAYAWKRKSKIELPTGTVYELELVSQSWQVIPWKHGMQVFVPKGVKPGAKMFLWNQGGAPSP